MGQRGEGVPAVLAPFPDGLEFPKAARFFPAPAFSPDGEKLVIKSSASTVTKITVDKAYMVGWIPRRTSL